MLKTTPEVSAILVHRGSYATVFVTGHERETGLIPVRLVRSVEEAFPTERRTTVDLVVVDVDSLGVDAGRAMLKELKDHPRIAGVRLVAWIKRPGDAALFKSEDVVVVKLPPAQKDRFAQLGQMVSACRTGGDDQLRLLAEESLKAR